MIRTIICWVLFAAGLSVAAEEPHCTVALGGLNWNVCHWEELSWKQSISRNKRLAQAERTRLFAAITAQLHTVDFDSEQEMRISVTETRIKYVDLNGDGKSEVIAKRANFYLTSLFRNGRALCTG